MAAGEAFSRDQRERIERAVAAAEAQTGFRFWVRVGALGADPRIDAETTLANLLPTGHEGGVLLLVGPEERQLEIMMSPAAKRRIPGQATGLAALTMTSSFRVGDLVGGIINGLRQLADSAGRDPSGTQGQVATAGSRLSGRSPLPQGSGDADETADPSEDPGSEGGTRPGSKSPDDAADYHDDNDPEASPPQRGEQPADGQGLELGQGPREIPGSHAAPGEVSASRR